MSPITAVDGGVSIRVKAVPGAKREQISGVLGDCLKVKVSAPPEGGKANAGICALIAKQLGVKASGVSLESGASSTEKRIRVNGITVKAAMDLLCR